jgi:hypothetical protein
MASEPGWLRRVVARCSTPVVRAGASGSAPDRTAPTLRSPVWGGQVAVRRLWQCRCNGTTEATQGLSGGRWRDQRFHAGVRRAGTTPRGRPAGARRLHGLGESGQRGQTQPPAPAIEGNRAAFRRHWPGCWQRLCAGWTAGCAGHSLRQTDRGFRGGASTPEDEEAGGRPGPPSLRSPACGERREGRQASLADQGR